MSQENVDAWRKSNEAFERGDWDAQAATFDPHILVRTDARWPEQRIYGRDAVVAFYREVRESAGSESHPEEIIDLGDRLVIRYAWSMRGQHSGVEGQLHFSEIVTFRDGRVILIEHFLDRDQALKAVGLAE